MPTSCVVSGTNADSWTGTSSSGKTSSPIQGQTIYTLHCIGVAGSNPRRHRQDRRPSTSSRELTRSNPLRRPAPHEDERTMCICQKARYVAALGIPLLAFLSFTLVAAWTDPTEAPPNGNVAAPINVGTTDQVKNGGLGVNSLTVFGNSLFGGSTGSNAYLNFGATRPRQHGLRHPRQRRHDGVQEQRRIWQSIQNILYTLCGGECGGGGRRMGVGEYRGHGSVRYELPVPVAHGRLHILRYLGSVLGYRGGVCLRQSRSEFKQ